MIVISRYAYLITTSTGFRWYSYQTVCIVTRYYGPCLLCVSPYRRRHHRTVRHVDHGSPVRAPATPFLPFRHHPRATRYTIIGTSPSGGHVSEVLVKKSKHSSFCGCTRPYRSIGPLFRANISFGAFVPIENPTEAPRIRLYR